MRHSELLQANGQPRFSHLVRNVLDRPRSLLAEHFADVVLEELQEGNALREDVKNIRGWTLPDGTVGGDIANAVARFREVWIEEG